MSLSVIPRLRGRATSVAVSAVAVGGLTACPAKAAAISLSACNGSSLSQPFLPWGDSSRYKLVNGGDFEGPLSGWSLRGSAAVVAGSEPTGATGSVGSSSLALPPGSSVQSPVTCADAPHPTFRFFIRSASPGSTLAVSAVYPVPLRPSTVPVYVVKPGTSWSPTMPMLTGPATGGLPHNGSAPVSFRFTELTGTSQIDDVFVDPHTMI